MRLVARNLALTIVAAMALRKLRTTVSAMGLSNFAGCSQSSRPRRRVPVRTCWEPCVTLNTCQKPLPNRCLVVLRGWRGRTGGPAGEIGLWIVMEEWRTR